MSTESIEYHFLSKTPRGTWDASTNHISDIAYSICNFRTSENHSYAKYTIVATRTVTSITILLNVYSTNDVSCLVETPSVVVVVGADVGTGGTDGGVVGPEGGCCSNNLGFETTSHSSSDRSSDVS